MAKPTETKAGIFQPLIDDLREALLGFWEVLEWDQVKAKFAAAEAVFKEVVTEFTQAYPLPGMEFLAAPGATPGPGQMTEEQFFRAVVDRVRAIDGNQTPREATVATLTQMFDLLRRFVSPEGYIRYSLALPGGKLSPDVVAQKAAEMIAASMATSMRATAASWSDGEGGEVPRDTDDEKELEEQRGGATCIPRKAIDGALRRLGKKPVKASSPGTAVAARAGRHVHRFVMTDYAEKYPGSLSVLDGRVMVWPETMRLSNIVKSPPSAAVVDARFPGGSAKLTRFRNVMTYNGKRIRPDIADLSFTQSGGRPDEHEGWFEVKPAAKALTGWDELHCFYMPFWNTGAPPRQKADSGKFYPDPLFWDPKTSCVCLVLPSIDGVIPYFVFESRIKEAALVTATLAAAALVTKGMYRAVKRLGDLVGTAGEAVQAFTEFVYAWAAVMAALLLVAAALASGAAATAAAAIVAKALAILTAGVAAFVPVFV